MSACCVYTVVLLALARLDWCVSECVCVCVRGIIASPISIQLIIFPLIYHTDCLTSSAPDSRFTLRLISRIRTHEYEYSFRYRVLLYLYT